MKKHEINNNVKDNLNKDSFQFVQRDERIFDTEFETKPIGYFKDAMSRFGKNRTNLVATSILVLLVLLSILVPTFTNKNHTSLEPRLAYLPARIPLLDKLGVFNGSTEKKEITVDLSTIDPETGIGMPRESDYVIHEYIIPGSVTNYYVSGTLKHPDYQGGHNDIVLRSNILSEGSRNYVIGNNTGYFFTPANTIFSIDVEGFYVDPDAELNILLETTYQEFTPVYTITEPGLHEFTIGDYVTNLPFLGMRFRIEVKTDSDLRARVSLNSVSMIDYTDPNNPNVLVDDEGYSLSQYRYISGSGDFIRRNAQRLVADFKYDAYAAAFRPLREITSESRYLAILAANPGMEETLKPAGDDRYPDAMAFDDGFVVKRILEKYERTIGGRVYVDYLLEYDFGLYKGFDTIPYFFFGTDAAGRDMFAMTFKALGTSLIIGIIVSAINISVGVVYGAISGYYGGKVDLIMERITEVVGRIPWLVTLSILTVHLGSNAGTLILILIISGWIGISSVTRTQFYRYKGREYVLASRTLGAKDGRLIFRHILPNAIGTIITSSVLMIPGVIFSESTISYLGFGIGHGQEFALGPIKLTGVSLGVLLADGQTMLVTYPHLTIYPAIIISILMISFNMFGNALRDAFNPSLRGVEE